MQGASSRRKRSAWTVYVAACIAAAPFATLQIAIAQTNGAQVAPETQPASEAVAVRTETIGAETSSIFSVAPLQGEVHSAFGPRPDPFTGAPAFHNGVDFRAPEGAPVVAPAAGRVLRVADWQGGYGMLIDIDHGGGLMTRYAHLSAFEVREGQDVAAGQLIARVGSTGRNIGGPHLHLEVWRDGEKIDPASVLPRHAP